MSQEQKLIRIGRPYIRQSADCARLCAQVELEGREHTMWFSTADRYGAYLTDDRADAFLTALLPRALRSGAEIRCEGPVTRRLLYQLGRYLLPTLAKNIGSFSPAVIHAEPTDAPLPCAGAVATGWTGGVDSLFTLMQDLAQEDPRYRLTHLFLMGNGAIVGGGKEETLQKLIRKTETGILREPALEGRLSLVWLDSNVQDILQEDYLSTVGFRFGAAVLALQKLFRVYFRSSDYPLSELRFDPFNSSRYEFFALPCFETNNTTIYYTGGPNSRFLKLKQLSSFSLAHKYLHPCICAVPAKNCNLCTKCILTETMLHVLGTLDRFSDVFDAETFRQNKDWYFAKVLNMLRPYSIWREDAMELLCQCNEDLSAAERMAAAWKAGGSLRGETPERPGPHH